ncbi:radical SAM-linked protein [Frankia sp. EI5c]|uniref:TIGR03936 family radical SAM-associated protein n=1 Tax=Frankia sp. EI5c TaxID=683316 RepID=UPI0007C283C4|nr:TIGR03936 family radical SAM-associated protein [Frankia sp. EI5c]OAA28802.1 radical SAM-linked protein [Frankia sp. EI5c]
MVARIRVRFAKRGRLRFLSHRDIARAFERALRRARLPVALSAGFSPHPRLSWVGAAPTGAASEAEYVEIAFSAPVIPEQVREALDAALPPGLDVVRCASAEGRPLPDRIDASRWQVRLPGVSKAQLEVAIPALMARDSLTVERVIKDGRREIDVRGAVVWAVCRAENDTCAILDVVVRHTTPAVRPDDVLTALSAVAVLSVPVPPEPTRLEQGRLLEDGTLADPLAPDRDEAARPVSRLEA